MNNMNEAEISSKIVLPLLKTLGMDYKNIKLENSFTIKTGRYSKETITWKENLRHPRYDILVTVDDRNLFIVEVKIDDITPDDVEQARIYAKLVDPVAPFVILTNGTTNKIFEAIDGNEITGSLSESKFAQDNFVINIDDETRELALYALFSLNYENFLNFCNKQNMNTLSRLKSDNQPNSVGKYISEIFVRRQHVNQHFYNFLNSDESCFLLTGKSGIGKTNVICNLVEEISQSRPVLFYNAGQLSNRLETEIGSDLNWEYSTDKSIERLFSQIDQICKKHKTKLILFVDAIDEWWSDTASVDISRFVEHIQDKDIKLVLSCKNSEIDKFLSIMGAPSSLSQNLFISNKKEIEKFVTIDDFNTGELIEAVGKYIQFFSLKQFFTNSETFAACKDPFLLRVISEVYQGKEVPATLNSAQIFEKYLDMLTEKKPDGLPSLSSILVEICRIMFEAKTNEIYENQLENANAQLFDFLVDYGIIRQQSDEKGRIKISFTFDGLRNYVIIFHLLQIDNKEISDLKKFIDGNSDTKMGLELIKWYKEIATEEHIQVLTQKIIDIDKKLAEEFLVKFVEKVDSDFPFIRNRLFPDTKLGLLVLYDKEKNFVYEYGYRCCKEGEDSVIWVDDKQSFWGTNKSFPLMEKYGVFRLMFTGRDFSNSPLDEFVYNQTLHITKEIIQKRLLDESKNVNISLEKFFASFRHWSSLLGYSGINYDTESSVLPIIIEPLMMILEQRGSKLTPYRYEEKPRTSVLTTLQEALHNLSLNMKQIDRTALPYCDDPNYPSRYVKPSPEYFTKEGLKDYLIDFIEKYIQEYRILVENNFPTLKNKFPLFQKSPYYVIMRLEKRTDDKKATSFTFNIFKNDDEQNEIEARNYDDDKIETNYEAHPFEVTTRKGIKKSNRLWGSMALTSLFVPTNSIFSDCPLTAFVYKNVERDLEYILGSVFKNIHIYIP